MRIPKAKKRRYDTTNAVYIKTQKGMLQGSGWHKTLVVQDGSRLNRIEPPCLVFGTLMVIQVLVEYHAFHVGPWMISGSLSV